MPVVCHDMQAGGIMDVTKIVANLDEMQDFINTEIHPLISPDHYNTYCQMIDLIDVMRSHVDEIQKAQEARLLTIEDFTPEKLRDIHHVWVEIRPGYYNGDVDKYLGGKPYPAVVTGWRDIRCNAIGNDDGSKTLTIIECIAFNGL